MSRYFGDTFPSSRPLHSMDSTPLNYLKVIKLFYDDNSPLTKIENDLCSVNIKIHQPHQVIFKSTIAMNIVVSKRTNQIN